MAGLTSEGWTPKTFDEILKEGSYLVKPDQVYILWGMIHRREDPKDIVDYLTK